MTKKLTLAERKFGLPPGSIINLGETMSQTTKIHLIQYNEKVLFEADYLDIEEALNACKEDCVNWLNVEGFANLSVFEKLGELKKVEKLTLEDILDPESRPKFEELDGYSLCVAKMMYCDHATELIFNEQISFLLFPGILITLQYEYGDVFDKIRERIRTFGGRIRLRKADYLHFALMDIMVDNYFIVIEKFDEKIQHIEDDLFRNPEKAIIPEIRRLKKDIILMRRAVYPLREAVGAMLKSDQKIFDKKNINFIKDLHEHTILAIENIENSRELTSGLMDIYISMINQKMSNISKVLTVIATIFIPLTFFTGVYGMNFEPLPGAVHPFGFWAMMIFLTVVFLAMVVYFRFKKWF